VATSTARLLALALAPASPETVDDATGERILDAALDLAAASGLRHLTMDDVAARARVGRMTVYRRFGNRQQLLDALTVREGRACLLTIAGAFDASASLDERVADVFVATLRVIREHPLLARLARIEPEALLQELTRNDSEVFALVRVFLVGQITAAQTNRELVATDPELLAELALRLGASFVLLPDSVFTRHDDDYAREAMRSLIAPLVSPRP
jgi:AcrR family transcriptional regulator